MLMGKGKSTLFTECIDEGRGFEVIGSFGGSMKG